MAKRLYPILCAHAGGHLGLSLNGKSAYDAGERPLFLWPEKEREGLEPTIAHHIEHTHRGRTRRLLVMFYRVPTDAPPAIHPKRKRR